MIDGKVVLFYNTAEYLLRFRLELIFELQQLGGECVALLPRGGSSEAERDRLKEFGVRIHELRFFQDKKISPLMDLLLTVETAWALRKLDCRLLINFTIKPCIYGGIASQLAGVPHTAAMITGLGYAFTGTNFRKRLISRIVQKLYRRSFQTVSAVFFQNTDDQALFVANRLIPPDRAHMVDGSGVDTVVFCPPASSPSQLTFLMVARILRDKGVIEFLEAANIAQASLNDARFVLVGPLDTNPTSLTQTDISRYLVPGVIEYVGPVKDPKPSYYASSVYVLPSYREGRPRTVLEAMACGLPIITTDVPGCRDAIEPSVNGILVPAQNSQALAAAMIAMGGEEIRRTMGKRSREIAESRFDVNLTTRRIVTVLDDLTRE